MRKQFRLAMSALAAFTLVAAACTGDDDDSGGHRRRHRGAEDDRRHRGTRPAAPRARPAGTEGTTAGTEGTEPGDTVDVAQGEDLNFHVITHGDDGVFWSVVQTAVEQAAADSASR